MSEPAEDARLIDAALTIATRSREQRGRGAASTRREYAREWGKYEAWCRPAAVDGRRERWLDPTDTSPERLAVYVSAMCAGGAAVKTAGKAIDAIRSTLRSRGLPVPDGLPARVVLREIEATRVARGLGARSADPLGLDELLSLLATLDPSVPRGVRDGAILHLMFAGLRVDEIASLVVSEVVAGPVGSDGLGPAVVAVATRPDRLVLPHWTSTDGRHESAVCGACALLAQRNLLVGRGAALDGPYVRAIDRPGRIAGLDPGWGGTRSRSGHRMDTSHLGGVLNRALARSGLAGRGRYVPQSLLLGGARTRLEQGAPGLGAFGGWSPRSRAVTDLLERHTPEGAGVVAVRWPESGRGGGDGQ